MIGFIIIHGRFHVKRLVFIIALVLAAGAARADTVVSFNMAAGDAARMTWDQKVDLVKALGGKFRKRCHPNAGCLLIASGKERGVMFTLTMAAPGYPSAPFKQWCVEELERKRCADEKE
jgi:hypothetical protein